MPTSRFTEAWPDALENKPDSDGGWRHTSIVLAPLNRAHPPIVMPENEVEDFHVLAEFVAVWRADGGGGRITDGP